MNRAARCVYCVRRGVPRASGDEPLDLFKATDYALVFPAPAGMNRRVFYWVRYDHSVPRASGDEPH